jgi:hypothetical protein
MSYSCTCRPRNSVAKVRRRSCQITPPSTVRPKGIRARSHALVLVHRLAPLLHASFRPRLATTPLLLTSIRLSKGLSPPSCRTCSAHKAKRPHEHAVFEGRLAPGEALRSRIKPSYELSCEHPRTLDSNQIQRIRAVGLREPLCSTDTRVFLVTLIQFNTKRSYGMSRVTHTGTPPSDQFSSPGAPGCKSRAAPPPSKEKLPMRTLPDRLHSH